MGGILCCFMEEKRAHLVGKRFCVASVAMDNNPSWFVDSKKIFVPIKYRDMCVIY